MVLYILFESASGYGLFERVEGEEIANQADQFQKAVQDKSKFMKIVRLKSFLPFTSAENALENINDVSEGVLNSYLKNFLVTNLPKGKSSKGISLGVSDDKLASAIHEGAGLQCEKNANTAEIIRGIRLHFEEYIQGLKEGDIEKAQRGLGHSYSRSKVKFNVHRVDNMIIQSISLLDQLDKDLNTFSMRCKEWYSWHFPELIKVVPDQTKYARLVKLIRNKAELSEDNLPALEEITESAELAQEILDAARASMGTDIAEIDLVNIESFAERVVQLSNYRTKLHSYLLKKMNDVAPNLGALIGEQVGARLIAHAGSLTNLAKYPASTVQILGAEKALFRALKTKGNTPKYGLIFHSSFIGKAAAKNKGRISRYLANKCSIASRIDSFSDSSTTRFGEVLREQVEERLRFYETGDKPRKNVDVMHETIEELKADGFYVDLEDKSDKMDAEETPKKKSKSEKRKKSDDDDQEDGEGNAAMEVETPTKKSKKDKKSKKSKSETPKSGKKVEVSSISEDDVDDAEEMEVETPKKSKKSKSETPKSGKKKSNK